MFLPLELAPLIFQFLPVETIEEFPENDPLLIAVLKIQDGCRPFTVYYEYSETDLYQTVRHMGIILEKAFSKEVLSSLGVVHRLRLHQIMPDTFASMFCKNDTADDSSPFSRVEELLISSFYRNHRRTDLSMFPKLRSLLLLHYNRGIAVSHRSRTTLLSYIGLPGGTSTLDGVCVVSSENLVVIEMSRGQGFMRLSHGCVDWMPCFDKSWCLSMELYDLTYSVNKVATLQGFPNLKMLKFLHGTIKLSQNWLPSIPLERLSFWECNIDETEFGFWPLVKKLDFRNCLIEPLEGHFPQLETLIFHESSFQQYTRAEDEENEQTLFPVPIAKENVRNVKSFSLSTKAKRFNLSSFKKLKDLEVYSSYQLTRLDGLNLDTLERVTIESCPDLKVDLPGHVSVTVSDVFPEVVYF